MSENIGIFRGKDRENNELILKTLCLKKIDDALLTPWQIAKEIYDLKHPYLSPETKKSEWYKATQQLNSLLVRKQGRLADLEAKGYIEGVSDGEGKRYCLAVKGLFATLIAFPEYIDKTSQISNVDLTPAIRFSMNLQKKVNPKLSYFGMELNIKPKKYISAMVKFVAARIQKEEGLLEIVTIIKEALKNGLNLDTCSNENLILWLASSKHFKKCIENFTLSQEGVEP